MEQISDLCSKISLLALPHLSSQIKNQNQSTQKHTKTVKTKTRGFSTSMVLLELLLMVIASEFPERSFGITPCRSFCGNIPINYPFGIDEGCGAPQFRGMFNCSTDLFFITPSGFYKVQKIDYEKNTMVIYDPAMSTCSILQPHHDFKMTEIQNAIMPPSYDTVFALLNCSIDSPVLNHYRNLCFNLSGHSCDELYGACSSFRIFNITGNSSSNTTPYCCFTGYDTVRVMSMNILDCTHYTSVIDNVNLRGVGPLDWMYGMELSYSVPDIGCGACKKSGGACGFDTETEGLLCLCSASNNATRECAAGGLGDQGGRDPTTPSFHAIFLSIQLFFYMLFCNSF